jgi:hypothetical protein
MEIPEAKMYAVAAWRCAGLADVQAVELIRARRNAFAADVERDPADLSLAIAYPTGRSLGFSIEVEL